MILQQDKGSAPQPFDTGLPRTQPSDDVPRWLIILGIVAACTLLVGLLRYAIDLLGVVFLIILVGFSIRAVSDWLTEGESVSLWALAAVFAGLFGTVMVGLWLFGSRDLTSGALEQGVPTPVLAVSDWLESHGWGQRVLLAGDGGGPTAPSRTSTQSSASASSSGQAPPRAEPSSPPSTPTGSGSEPRSRERKTTPRSNPGEAEAATLSSLTPTGGLGSRSPRTARGTDSPGQDAVSPHATEAPAVEAAAVGTTIALISSHPTSAVGVSVRFTATITADGSSVPTGIVVFFDGDSAIGTSAVHGADASATAVLSTLNLAIGDHQITAEFQGTHGFLGSRSQPISQTITRR
jgi:hypothetical protein